MNELLRILVDDIDDKVLDRMPGWFKTLREAYQERLGSNL